MAAPEKQVKPSDILIVEDNPSDLRLLNELLIKEGYQIRPLPNGPMALKAAENVPPDLILLDIKMPDMNGFEVCKRLKENERLRDIPILFISALNDLSDKIEAFKLGGVDYITKPFQAEEVYARINIHLELIRLQNELRDQNKILEKTVQERTADLLASNLQLKQEIEERKKLKKELIQSQKMEAVGRLAAGVAHDFNNLLMIINGYSEFSQKGVSPDEPLYSHLEEIKKAVSRATALTRQLLTFSRKQVIQSQTVNLNDLIQEISKMLRRLIGEDVELNTNFDSSLNLLSADPGQLEQIIMNLAVNARDAMPKGGALTIQTANVILEENSSFKYAENQSGSHVMLAISDTGCGIDEETLEKIFDPFFTTKEKGKGTGLGLSTVYGIVTQSNGIIDVSSELAKGTTFRIFLPGLKNTEIYPLTAPKPEISYQGSETILVVEDDESVRTIVSRILKEHGYNVLEAENGIHAERIYQECKAPIHLILTDMVMPEKSGRELYESIRSLNSGIKFLFISGYSDNALLPHEECEDGTSFLQKPIMPMELVKKVREMIDRE